MSDAIAKLDALPKEQYRKTANWPKGANVPLTKSLAEHFTALLSTCDSSLCELLRNHPELPHYFKLDNWRRNKPWFNDLWKRASHRRAHFLAEQCVQLAHDACPKTAHVVRVKFDVYRWFCSRLHPEVYGDKPQQQQQTTVNVGVSITPERLSDIRAKLDLSRNGASHRLKTSRSDSTNDSLT